MKRKLFILSSMVIFTVIAVTNFNFITNTHNFGICLSDLAVMAHANGESLPCECGDLLHYECYAYENKCACRSNPEIMDPPVNCNKKIPLNCDC